MVQGLGPLPAHPRREKAALKESISSLLAGADGWRDPEPDLDPRLELTNAPLRTDYLQLLSQREGHQRHQRLEHKSKCS